MLEAQLKGSAYLSTMKFIDSHFGADGRKRVLDALSEEDRALLSGLVVAIGWYPLAPFPRLLRAMEQELGKGDLSLVTERGAWAAVNDMKTVHRVLLKFVSVDWVIDKGTNLWPNFHTSGRWTVKRDADNKRVVATLHGLGVVDEAMCATLKGWIIGLISLAGVKDPIVEHVECRARGAHACVYHVDWQ